MGRCALENGDAATVVIPVRKMTDLHGPAPSDLNGGDAMIKTDAGDKPGLKMVNPGAAAVDIGSTMHMAAVNPDSDDMSVRAFGTFSRVISSAGTSINVVLSPLRVRRRSHASPRAEPSCRRSSRRP
jgi:hypothetical protein